MDWKASLITFALIFFAELGDKTQLMVMSMSARSKAPHMIFLGASAALIASSLLAVLAGDFVLKAVPLRLIRIGTGTLFVAMGALLIIRSVRW